MVRLTGVDSETLPADASSPDDLAGKRHRQFIGYVGLLLPILIIELAELRDGVAAVANLDSISAYYYSGANAAFVGMLVALAIFLFFYRGYKNDRTKKPNRVDIGLAWVASMAALVVAFFPTKAPDGFTELSWWTERTGELHFGAAIVLFTMFAVFCLFRFPKSADGETTVPTDKKVRNGVYWICGLAILVFMGWAGLNASNSEPIFWQEAGALFFFALSWLVKGYAHTPLISFLHGAWVRVRRLSKPAS